MIHEKSKKLDEVCESLPMVECCLTCRYWGGDKDKPTRGVRLNASSDEHACTTQYYDTCDKWTGAPK